MSFAGWQRSRPACATACRAAPLYRRGSLPRGCGASL